MTKKSELTEAIDLLRRSTASGFSPIFMKSLEVVIDEAERVQELEELDALYHYFLHENLDINKVSETIDELVTENKRLCEVLEGLLHIEAITQPNDYEELLKNIREYVVEALEQSK